MRLATLATACSIAIGACGHDGTPVHPADGGLSLTSPLQGLPGLVSFNEQSWDTIEGNGWNYLRRTASRSSDIVSDSAAPVSSSTVLRMIFTTDMARDSEPGVHWVRLPIIREVYASWSVKWSPDWKCSPAGCGKIAFLRTEDEGTVYINYGDFGRTANPRTISVNTQWAPYGQRVWTANRTATTIVPGTWYRIAWYQKYSSRQSAADGVIRWWVDDVLNGEYTDVRFPHAGFVQFEFAPTLQDPPPLEQYMYIDHTHISIG